MKPEQLRVTTSPEKRNRRCLTTSLSQSTAKSRVDCPLSWKANFRILSHSSLPANSAPVALFVINEWLWSDLSGDNHLQAQREAFRVIEKLPTSDHQIVVIEDSPFDRKAWILCRNDNPMIVQRIAGLFVASVRQNSDRCLILKPNAVVVIPAELAGATNPDDHYLIQALLTAAGATLVTTDNALREAVSNAGHPCLSRNDFLATYF